jgi:hypothetical protein
MAAQLGDVVIYTATDGTSKVAFVVATPESVEGTDYAEGFEAGTVSLRVFSPSGSSYHKAGITEGTGPLTYAVKA